MTLIEELREQLSGTPRNATASIGEMTDSFRSVRSEMSQISQFETTENGVIYEDRTDPDVRLEIAAHDIARQWIDARRHQGVLGN